MKKFIFDPYQKQALKICVALNNAGYKAYWVGGAVRDMLLQRPNFDIDIATDANPQKVKRVLKALNFTFFSIGEKFGTIGAIAKNKNRPAKNLLPKAIEITTFRSEQNYADFRHPKKVRFVSSAETDAQRRDFTINALYFDPQTFEILDYVNGLIDLKAQKINFVGRPEKRIIEDPLRTIRAVRFAAELEFKIDPKSAAAIRKYRRLINKVSWQRVRIELDKIMLSKNRAVGIALLYKLGLFDALYSELDRDKILWLKKYLQPKKRTAKEMSRLVSGREVMRILKLQTGPKVGAVLKKISLLQKRKKIFTKDQAIKYLKSLDKPSAQEYR